MGGLRTWRVTLWLGGLAFLAYLERMILDWRYVYDDFIGLDDAATTLFAIAVYLTFAAVWLWALVATARHEARGIYGLAILSGVLLVAMGLATPAAFCPLPCEGWARWPLLEWSNWAGLAIGVLTLIAGLGLVLGERSGRSAG